MKPTGLCGGRSGLRIAALVAAGVLPAFAHAQGAAADAINELVYYDYVNESGELCGGNLLLPVPPGRAPRVEPGGGTRGIDNRIDLVVVGDGYIAQELGRYAQQADQATAALFNKEPFARYRSLFVVHRVDVVSAESGVDNDPVPGISRNTAMDMGFWCNNIERLLCINVNAAYGYAAAAPDVDQVLALANSTKYGGAGYTSSELATASGGNVLAAEIAIHEFGHSIGNLADEYDYGDGAAYSGPERSERNVSILTSGQMQAAGTKWAPWLGINDPAFDGLISTFEGAYYNEFGIYRPTNNSLMRNLNRPFNLPSIEGLLVEMYRIVRPIDNSTPVGQALDGSETVFVDPVDPVGHPLTVQWSLDGTPIEGATGPELNLVELCVRPGVHQLSVRVVDNTTWVRRESLRQQWMTQTLSWTVTVADCDGDGIGDPCDDGREPCDTNCDGSINGFDIQGFVDTLSASPPPPCSPCAADTNADGSVNGFDIQGFVECLSGP